MCFFCLLFAPNLPQHDYLQKSILMFFFVLTIFTHDSAKMSYFPGDSWGAKPLKIYEIINDSRKISCQRGVCVCVCVCLAASSAPPLKNITYIDSSGGINVRLIAYFSCKPLHVNKLHLASWNLCVIDGVGHHLESFLGWGT